MADEDDLNDPGEPDESDVCPHGHGFDTYCSYCDDGFEDEAIAVCPECGGDDLEVTGTDANGDNEYECNDCGETFGEDDLEGDDG